MHKNLEARLADLEAAAPMQPWDISALPLDEQGEFNRLMSKAGPGKPHFQKLSEGELGRMKVLLTKLVSLTSKKE